MTRSLGIDISRYQDNPDTSKRFDFAKAVANNADFIFIKASQSSWADRDFLYNWMSAGDAGLLRGAYHYLSWIESAEAQAYFFTGLLKQEPGELPPVVDFESRYKLPIKSEMQRRLRTFCAIVNEQLGVDPIIYTGPSYWREFGSQDLSWERYPLWIANYGRKAPDVPLPWGSNEWTFWQKTDKGDGLKYGAESLQIDMNWYNGTREELFAWAGDNYVAPTYQICPLDETRCYRDE